MVEIGVKLLSVKVSSTKKYVFAFPMIINTTVVIHEYHSDTFQSSPLSRVFFFFRMHNNNIIIHQSCLPRQRMRCFVDTEAVSRGILWACFCVHSC